MVVTRLFPERTLRAMAVILLTMAATCLLFAASPRTRGFEKILFACTDKYNHSQIFSINPDGSALMQITNVGGKGASDPSVSPNGKYISYVALGEYPQSAIYTMEANGTNITKVYPTQSDYADESIQYPRFTSDGSSIIFSSFANKEFTFKSIRLINGKMSTMSSIGKFQSPKLKTLSNGDILYTDYNSGKLDACRIKANGTGRQVLASSAQSPDLDDKGNLTFCRSSFTSNIYFKAVNSEEKKLTGDENVFYDPVFSPDGSKIAFCGYNHAVKPDTYHYVSVINTDGTGYKELITNLRTRPVKTIWTRLSADTTPTTSEYPWDKDWEKFVNPPQPDLAVSEKSNPAMIGQGKISIDDSQKITTSIASRRFGVYYITVKNTGSISDRFTVKEEILSDAKSWIVKAYSPTGLDLSFNLQSTYGIVTPEIPAGGSYQIRLDVSPSSSAKNDSIVSVAFTAFSVIDTIVADRVLIETAKSSRSSN